MPDCCPENYLAPSPAHGLPGSPFTWCSPLRAPSPLVLSLPVPPPRTRDKYASYVWNASILLADKIVAGEIDVSGKRVLELGAGLGLPSVVAARKGAEMVTLTDFDHREALEDTARSVDAVLSPEVRRRVHILPHTWGTSIDPLLELCHAYDLILVADCVWTRELHAPLITTLVSLLQACPHATVHFAAGFHTGRRTVSAFLAQAELAGIVRGSEDDWIEISVSGEVRPWHSVQGGLRKCSDVVPDEREDSQEERNRWTLYGTLRLQLQ